MNPERIDSVDVVAEQTSNSGGSSFIFVALFPCAINQEYVGNRTERDVTRELRRRGVQDPSVSWVDAVKFSSNTTNAGVIYGDEICGILESYDDLIHEYFVRFRERVVREAELIGRMPVCVTAGMGIVRSAFDKWIEKGYIEETDVIHESGHLYRLCFVDV